MRAVVTGSDGFIGRHLVDALVSGGCEVIGLDKQSGADVLDCELPNADVVFHLAAQTDAYCADAAHDAMTNVVGTVRVLERYRERVVLASSSMVSYPVAPYAISKRACEEYAKHFGAAIVRLCNIVGPGGHGVFQKFEQADELSIYGTGDQLRTYAPVQSAVSMLMDAKPGELLILRGVELTINEIAGSDKFVNKPRRYLPARPLDMIDGRQIIHADA